MHKGVRSRRQYREMTGRKVMIYEADIELGHTYRDPHTGFEGTAVAVYFYEYGCPRVNLKKMGKEGTLIEAVFDAPGVTATTVGANGKALGFTS